MLRLRPCFSLFVCLALAGGLSAAKVFHAADYGIVPGEAAYTASDVARMLAEVRQACAQEPSAAEPIRLLFKPGTYEIGPEQCQARTWFISNHDQDNPKRVFLPLEGLTNVELCGNGALFNLHARIIPFGIWDSQRVTLGDFTVDYACPPLSQITFTAVDPEAKRVTFRPLPELKPELDGTRLTFRNPEFRHSPGGGILFEPDGTIAYRTGDLGFNLGNVAANPDGTFTAADCAHPAFRKGQAMVLRAWGRPAPGIVVSDSKEVSLQAITLHYADGMGVLAQSSDGIELKGIRILPNAAKGRFFSTQADATHFSGCGGEIFSTGGRYIGMMDDAINVHGTYLRVQKRIDDRTLEAAYMHGQSYGFTWGAPGEEVAFIRSQTMEPLAKASNTLASIEPLDKPETRAGAKRFRLTFAKPLPPEVDPAQGPLGIENLTRTPSVTFENNYVGKNRARGALFSTPKPVLCANNLFDRTSGSAVLLCGDCNGWYETGACTDVTIRHNTFINALTSPYQFTEAVISLCPEIPDLDRQQAYFHRNITIQDNTFVAFDAPLVYAKSVDGLNIKGNTLETSAAFAPYHWNREWLTLRRCSNVQAEEPKTIQQP